MLERVLAIDDDPDVNAMLDLALDAVGGLDARIVTTVVEARSVAATFHPQLLLVDARLGTEDGVALADELRSTLSSGPRPPAVVILSADQGEAMKQRAAEINASALFAKPFDPLLLADELREVFERH